MRKVHQNLLVRLINEVLETVANDFGHLGQRYEGNDWLRADM